MQGRTLVGAKLLHVYWLSFNLFTAFEATQIVSQDALAVQWLMLSQTWQFLRNRSIPTSFHSP